MKFKDEFIWVVCCYRTYKYDTKRDISEEFIAEHDQFINTSKIIKFEPTYKFEKYGEKEFIEGLEDYKIISKIEEKDLTVEFEDENIKDDFLFSLDKSNEKIKELIRTLKDSKYDKKYLVLHKFGYYESCSEIYEDDSILDLIIIPGIVFDKNKNRIGFGGGYYDKFLYKLKENHNKNNTKLPLIVAVCYDFQLLNSIPYEKHDIKPDIIITEKQTIK